MINPGTLHGVGVGPGDPELVTVKAARLIGSAPVLAYFAKKGRRGHARTIVDTYVRPGTEELPLHYPLTTEMSFADPLYVREVGGFYAEAAEALATHLAAGRDVVLIAEGDPLFYGSFMHLYIRLKDRFPVRITPGVTGFSGCASAAGLPMTWGDDVLAVLPGTLGEDDLTERLAGADAAVIMKLGTNFPKVRRAIARAGLAQRAIYIERGSMEGEVVLPLNDKTDDASPYFSLILIGGEGRRP
ncbi:precorrin-2 C(20)-methyltransferase [Pleomorphomonas oryzae]|uniref:precorrin-2 C(20)-methyltransferase n=1 Tax=Pleomorphomonas oryzae TaxID=261934 RepID=UPI0004280088|nr:precorrin-2 C(20)-methyltransferase [Pleomorphomonas oryzae]